MGRAQGLKDSFSSVLGDGRGLRPEQIAASSAPSQWKLGAFPGGKDAPFSSHIKVAIRRMTVLRLWLKNGNEPRTFTSIRRLGQPVYWDTSGLSAVRADMKYLVENGICFREPGRTGIYTVRPITEWPKDHQQQFHAWQKRLDAE